MVDNGASYSISNNIDDFIEPPTKIGPKIQGFAGSLTTSLIGTVKWYITDDDGRTHSIILPNTSYVPTADIRMLSPQHWAQVTNDLLANLIEALKEAPDSNFQRWLSNQVDLWSMRKLDWKQDGSDLMEECVC